MYGDIAIAKQHKDFQSWLSRFSGELQIGHDQYTDEMYSRYQQPLPLIDWAFEEWLKREVGV